jgi:hypothetical protein
MWDSNQVLTIKNIEPYRYINFLKLVKVVRVQLPRSEDD